MKTLFVSNLTNLKEIKICDPESFRNFLGPFDGRHGKDFATVRVGGDGKEASLKMPLSPTAATY